MEWNGDTLWWEDGVKVQVHGNRAKGALAEALLPPGKVAPPAAVPAGPALHAAGRRSSTPTSPAASYSQGIRYSKKYSMEPPKRQPWFEFLVSSSSPAAAAGFQQQHTTRLPPVAIDSNDCSMSFSRFQLLEVDNLHAHLPSVIELQVERCSPVGTDCLHCLLLQPLQATVKPMLRPRKPYSPKNQQSIDKQAAQDQQVAAARSARYKQQAAQLASHNHHHSLQLGPAGAEPEPNVVQGDKGRRKPEWAR